MEQSSSCRNDYVLISEGTDPGKILGRYCGRRRPITIRSDENVVFIRFKSNSYIERRGFQGQYLFEDKPQTTTTTTTTPTTTTTTLPPGLYFVLFKFISGIK